MIRFENLKVNEKGLVPVVVQDTLTGIVLMLAYMNEEAFNKSLETGFAYYYSRSREKLWLKGETSGNLQEIVEMSIDCDEDTLLIQVKQKGAGVSCHTGRLSCFYRSIDKDRKIVDRAGYGYGYEYECGYGKNKEEYKEEVEIEAEVSTISKSALQEQVKIGAIIGVAATTATATETKTEIGVDQGAIVLQQLYEQIVDRKENKVEGSYTNYLFDKGIDKILKKVGEESSEIIIAAKNPSNQELCYEISDFVYHLTVLMVERKIELQDIYSELKSRRK